MTRWAQKIKRSITTLDPHNFTPVDWVDLRYSQQATVICEGLRAPVISPSDSSFNNLSLAYRNRVLNNLSRLNFGPSKSKVHKTGFLYFDTQRDDPNVYKGCIKFRTIPDTVMLYAFSKGKDFRSEKSGKVWRVPLSSIAYSGGDYYNLRRILVKDELVNRRILHDAALLNSTGHGNWHNMGTKEQQARAQKAVIGLKSWGDPFTIQLSSPGLRLSVPSSRTYLLKRFLLPNPTISFADNLRTVLPFKGDITCQLEPIGGERLGIRVLSSNATVDEQNSPMMREFNLKAMLPKEGQLLQRPDIRLPWTMHVNQMRIAGMKNLALGSSVDGEVASASDTSDTSDVSDEQEDSEASESDVSDGQEDSEISESDVSDEQEDSEISESDESEESDDDEDEDESDEEDDEDDEEEEEEEEEEEDDEYERITRQMENGRRLMEAIKNYRPPMGPIDR